MKNSNNSVCYSFSKIQNGKRKFYALKDKKLVRRAKGAIELELNMIYNPVSPH